MVPRYRGWPWAHPVITAPSAAPATTARFHRASIARRMESRARLLHRLRRAVLISSSSPGRPVSDLLLTHQGRAAGPHHLGGIPVPAAVSVREIFGAGVGAPACRARSLAARDAGHHLSSPRQRPISCCSAWTASPKGEVPLPGIGTCRGSAASGPTPSPFFTFSRSPQPPAPLSVRPADRQTSTLFRPGGRSEVRPETTTRRSRCSTRRRTARRSRCSSSTRKGLKRDGTNPTLLYGYGGFNVSLTPAFASARSRGSSAAASIAIANLRGGGEYGEAWHQAGMLDQEAERVRRLHRRGGVPDRRAATRRRTARDRRRQQRRAAGRRGDDPAARSSSARWSARCRCSTCCATTTSRSARLGPRVRLGRRAASSRPPRLLAATTT